MAAHSEAIMLNKAIFQSLLLALCFISLNVPRFAYAELLTSVSGKVIAADDGAGVSAVRVLLMSPQKGKITEAKSISGGFFVLRDVPKGQYDLLAIADDPYLVSLKTPVTVNVLEGKNLVGVVLKVERGGAIKGRLVTGNGQEVPHANIVASNSSSAKTDSNGYFFLKGIPAGTI